MLLGTFWVWILLGLAEWDADVPDWIPPTAVALGLLTTALTAGVAVTTFRGRPRGVLIALTVLLQLGLAVATAVAFGDALGTAILVGGAGVVALSGSGRQGPIENRT